MSRFFSTTVILAVLAAACAAFTAAGADSAGAFKTEYYSDYFSFVGSDGNGMTAFAIDSNRGRAEGRFQAEHFVIFYDPAEGWVPLSGGGDYPNDEKLLKKIPPSKAFRIKGDAGSGWTVESDENGIRLSVSPVSPVIDRQNAEGTYRLGASAATLYRNGRRIDGRVIHEYLHWARYNRLAGKSPGTLNDFNGLYLKTENGFDLYLHDQKDDPLGLSGKATGFATFDGDAEIDRIEFAVTGSDQALGFFRWPAKWAGTFACRGKTYTFHIETISRNVVKSWVIGGFAMSAVKGVVTSEDGKNRYTVEGLAELII